MTTIFEKGFSSKLTIKIMDEEATSTDPARIVICTGDKQSVLLEIVAKIERKQSADGMYFNCVTLKVAS